ncbi:MAG: aminoacyl-tRNA hydrolase [Eubacteriales bacterium]|nr:aminoacyl-tRNA hydrolase [Eubacteriales bacterium]
MSIFDIFAKLEQEEKSKPTVSPIEWLVVGLGNPGKKYEKNRHNTGFRVMDALCSKHGVRCDRAKFQALTGEAVLGGHRCLLMKPQTFMNASGDAVAEAADFYNVPPEHILVIFDDISLPVGTLRIRPKGSAGGQNGVKNIIFMLGSELFPRIKVGVGAKPHPDYDLAAWVLSNVTEEEMPAMNDAVDRAVLAVSELIANGVPAATQKYNGKVKQPEQCK